DHGSAVAAGAARRAGGPLGRDGGQAQFIVHEPPQWTSSLAPLLQWVATHLNTDLSVEKVARRAAMSTRTLSRRFRDQTGTTPLQWLLTERIRRAQQLLESSDLSIEQIANKGGLQKWTNRRARLP